MDARYDWLTNELQNSLGLGTWNSALGNSLSSDLQSLPQLKNGAMGLPLNHTVGIKGGGRTDELAAALKGLQVENDNSLIGFTHNKMSAEQMVSGLTGSEFLKLGAWNGTDLKTASSVAVSTNANLAGTIGSNEASWGHMPVRQDAAWDSVTTVGKFSDPATVVGGDVPNDGTEIWRSTLPSTDLPAVTARSKIQQNGPTLWNDPRAQYMLSAMSAPVHPSSWDSSSAKAWGARVPVDNVQSLPLPDMLRQLSAPNKFGTSSEADFGVWSHSSTTLPSQQPPIDNGTAIWGSPPSLGEATTTTASRPPTTPALPFSIDLTVPPPPLPKTIVCPPASAWNPSAQVVRVLIIWLFRI